MQWCALVIKPGTWIPRPITDGLRQDDKHCFLPDDISGSWIYTDRLGAIIIENNVVKATRVILPVNNEKNIPEHFGLRHRAAIGITEKTDALCIAVSEETGKISYIKDGEFVLYKNYPELIEKIRYDLN